MLTHIMSFRVVFPTFEFLFSIHRYQQQLEQQQHYPLPNNFGYPRGVVIEQQQQQHQQQQQQQQLQQQQQQPPPYPHHPTYPPQPFQWIDQRGYTICQVTPPAATNEKPLPLLTAADVDFCLRGTIGDEAFVQRAVRQFLDDTFPPLPIDRNSDSWKQYIAKSGEEQRKI